MPNIVIGNKSFVQSISVLAQDGEPIEVFPQTSLELPLGEYRVLVVDDSGWNLANHGQEYRPETGTGETWEPERQPTESIKITSMDGLIRTVSPNSGIQLDSGVFAMEVA